MSRTWAETFASSWRRKTTQHVATAPSKAVSCGGRTRAARAHRPFEPEPPLEVYMAIGHDSCGPIIHQRYVRGRKKEGGGRKRLPGDTIFVNLAMDG